MCAMFWALISFLVANTLEADELCVVKQMETSTMDPKDSTLFCYGVCPLPWQKIFSGIPNFRSAEKLTYDAQHLLDLTCLLYKPWSTRKFDHDYVPREFAKLCDQFTHRGRSIDVARLPAAQVGIQGGRADHDPVARRRDHLGIDVTGGAVYAQAVYPEAAHPGASATGATQP